MHRTFPKNEKLKSKKHIEQLFAEGRSITSFPVKCLFITLEENDSPTVKVAFGVPKRNFRNAVDRNRVKRLMREAYRQNKALIFNKLTTSHALMILYLGKSEPEFKQLNEATQHVLRQLFNHIHHENSHS